MNPEPEFEILGKVTREPRRQLETFPRPEHVERVVLESDEVTSLCPVTGQPDWETVHIAFAPRDLCIESKSLKLYFWAFRQEGHFCEALAGRIAQDIHEAIKPHWVSVRVSQKPRGGISIVAEARIPRLPENFQFSH